MIEVHANLAAGRNSRNGGLTQEALATRWPFVLHPSPLHAADTWPQPPASLKDSYQEVGGKKLLSFPFVLQDAEMVESKSTSV